jgi:hypothetical protein
MDLLNSTNGPVVLRNDATRPQSVCLTATQAQHKSGPGEDVHRQLDGETPTAGLCEERRGG